MKVRLATIEDMPVLLEIYQRARAFMMQAGNPNQWPEGHPSKDELLEEMRQDRFYVLESEGIIQASFVYYQGIDPCYKIIYDGEWLNDEHMQFYIRLLPEA